MLFATVRLAELVALDVEDVRSSARKGVLVIRSGKGDSHREVPLNALARQVLDDRGTTLNVPEEVAATFEVAKKITESGLEMVDRLVHAEYDFLCNAIDSTAKSLSSRDGAPPKAAQ